MMESWGIIDSKTRAPMKNYSIAASKPSCISSTWIHLHAAAIKLYYVLLIVASRLWI